MNEKLRTVSRTLSPRAVAASLLDLALELNHCSAGFLAQWLDGRWRILSCPNLDEETLLETREIQKILDPKSPRGHWQPFSFTSRSAQKKASAVVLSVDRRPFKGVLALFSESPRKGEIDALSRRLSLNWGEQLAGAMLLDQRIHDPNTGLLQRSELEATVTARKNSSILLVEFRGRRLSDRDLGHCARLMRRSFPMGVAVLCYSRNIFAAVLETRDREELRAMKDAIASAFLKVPTFKNLDLFFGAALQEKTTPAEKLVLLASGALAEAVAMGSPELIIRPNQYSRRSRSTGNLRRGTGRMARARPTVDAFYILKAAAASKKDESLRFILEALLSSLSLNRDAFLDTLIARLCHWLDAEKGAYYKGPKGGALKFEWTLTESGQRSSDPLTIDERVLRVVQISGRCECFAVEEDHWILALPLREGSQDLCLVFKFPPERERFLIPPALLTSLLLAIETAFELFRLRDRHDKDRGEIKALRERIEGLKKSQTGELVPVKPKRPELAKGRYQRIIGRSAAMGRVLRIMDRVTDSDVPVLIQGETGTGKELVARCLHENGPRFEAGFLTINCSALSETLMESELFGHTKGAFTGATEDKEGYFERADGGTLFLDEVQDMSPLMQRELLRVLQEGEVQRVGGKRIIKVDVRIIAATNKDLKELVNEGRFRQDLYYRLNVVIVDLPPLRRRREDLPELVDHFLALLSERYSLTRPRLEQDALQMLIEHDWAGNIRELQNLLEKTLLMLDGQVIRARDIRFEGSGEMRPRPVETYFDKPYKDAKESFLKEYLKSCLARHGGHVTKAAKEAGIVRSSFHKMMAKHNISTKDFLPMRRDG